MKVYGRSKVCSFALPAFLLAACVLLPTFGQAQMTSVGIDCSQITSQKLLMQENLRAGRALIECGVVRGGQPVTKKDVQAAPPNVRVSNRSCANSSNCTKSESFAWGNGSTIVVNFNDHNGNNQYSGTSVSTDGGTTFNQIIPAPFASGHGLNFGDPIVVFNAKLNKWFAGDLVSGNCGNQGIGLWTSTDGQTWTTGGCAHNGSSDDRESMWVDNEPTSGVYGRMYVAWSDFSVGQGRLTAAWSDDGTAWHTVALNNGSTFIRPTQLTGSPVGAPRVEGNNSTVFLAGMNEGGGGFANRQNLMFKSLDGGLTWTSVTMGAAFPAIKDGLCDNPYFAKVNPIIRHMGWGQPAVGPNGVVHYAYAGLGTGGDPGDVYYTRSTDNGVTWSTPIQINGTTDAPFKSQWMPSVSADANGKVTVSWYDRFKSTSACSNPTDVGCKYQRALRQSADNGVTWAGPKAVSNLMPQPAQPDPLVQACYAGDYNYNTTLGGSALITWTDGRRNVGGTNVQDVGFAKVPLP